MDLTAKQANGRGVSQQASARTVYELLRKLYSVHDHTTCSALYTDLCILQCGNRVQEYVTKWRGGINQLRAAKFIISSRMVIERYLDRLPTSVPYQILCFRVVEKLMTSQHSLKSLTMFLTSTTFIVVHLHLSIIHHVYHPLPLRLLQSRRMMVQCPLTPQTLHRVYHHFLLRLFQPSPQLSLHHGQDDLLLSVLTQTAVLLDTQLKSASRLGVDLKGSVIIT